MVEGRATDAELALGAPSGALVESTSVVGGRTTDAELVLGAPKKSRPRFARWLVPSLLLTTGLTAADLQPVLVPQGELVRQLDPAQEWLFLPVAEWRQLLAAGKPGDTAPVPPGAGLGSATVQITGDEHGLRASAVLEAVVESGTLATVPLFAAIPERLGQLTVGGSPGLTARGGGLDLMLPGTGRWPVAVAWGQAAPATGAAGWTASVPLPLAVGVDVVLTVPAGWEARGPGLTPDGANRWRLAGGQRQLVVELRPAGGQAPAWGASQRLGVDLPAVGAGGTFTWSLGTTGGRVPDPLRVVLPAGFQATAGGDIQGDGSVLVRSGAKPVITGLVAPGAGLDLPTLAEARWQGGQIDVAVAGPSRLDTPPGWIPVAVGDGQKNRDDGRIWRSYAVVRPGQPVRPEALAATGPGLEVATAGAVAVAADGTVHATWVLEFQAQATLSECLVTLPAGWRVRAASLGELPPADEVPAAPWPLAITLPRLLPPGQGQRLVFTLEHPVTSALALVAPSLTGARRSTLRVLLAADPTRLVQVTPAPGWRLGPSAVAPPESGLEPVAELLASDAAPGVDLGIRLRPVRVEAEAACWLLPRGEDTLVQLDLRLEAHGGSLGELALTLPTPVAGEHWRSDSPGVTLVEESAGFRLVWPAAWSGERQVRLAARLAAPGGATGAIRPALTLGTGGVPLRLTVAALAGDRVDVRATPAGRTLEVDELPAWAVAPPGSRILAVWRPAAAGPLGGVTARVPTLYAGPQGFLDQVQVRSQIGPGGGRTYLGARLAAPGLTALAIELPPGMTLEEATVDGETAPVRRDGDGRVAVLLPGRTQVQLALFCTHPVQPGALTLGVPKIGLPWLTTAWEVAVAPAWRVTPGELPGGLHLTPVEAILRRQFWGSWTSGAPAPELEMPPIRIQPAPAQAQADPRLLAGPSVLPPPVRTGERPPPPLIGVRWSGTRLGAPTGVRLDVVDNAAWNTGDRWGRALGLLVVLGLLGRIRMLGAALLGLAAGSGTAALLLAQVPLGVLLGSLETLCLGTPLLLLVAWWRARRLEKTP